MGGVSRPVDVIEADLHATRIALETGLGVPFSDGNALQILRNGDAIFPAMLEAIDAAMTSIEFLTFVYWTGDIAEKVAGALAKAAQRGVRTNVLLDGVGAASMSQELIAAMKGAGVQVEWFRPPLRWKVWDVDNRTHRKILICDGKVGFTGGVGIAEEWEGDARNPSEWRETHFRIEGPAVRDLRGAFISNWLETGQALEPFLDPLPSPTEPGGVPIQVIRGASSIGWTDISTLMQLMILVARRRLRITTAYFAPDDVMHDLLCAAVERGVEVEVLLPGPHTDQRFAQLAGEAEYQSLLDAGVHLWNYQRTMLHAKTLTVDGQLSCIGSANFNHRSMLKDDELNLVVLDPELTEELDRDFDEDLEYSERIDSGRWRHRSPWQRVKEASTRPFRRQL